MRDIGENHMLEQLGEDGRRFAPYEGSPSPLQEKATRNSLGIVRELTRLRAQSHVRLLTVRRSFRQGPRAARVEEVTRRH